MELTILNVRKDKMIEKRNKKNKSDTLRLSSDLIFVRHAEEIRDSDIDNNLLPLTNLGIAQAQEVSKLLENQFDIIFCSTSMRALITARIISHGEEPIQDKRLLERGWGNKKQDGNETDKEAEIRIINFLKEIMKKYSGKRILIVTHGALIKIAQNAIENNVIDRGRLNNCATIKYTKNGKKLVLKN